MRALVTGGDGFVGEHLVARLLEDGADVAASALTLPPDRNTLTGEQMGEVEWKVADVLDRSALYRLVAAVRPDRIYHLAAFSSGARARESPDVALQVNAGGTVNLMEAILEARQDFPELDPLVLILSSGEAYGDAEPGPRGLSEDVQLRPVSPYGLSKASQELVAHSYRRAAGLRTVVARPFNLVGAGQKEHFVVPSFCRQVHEIAAGRSEPVLHVGDLDVERDFTHVRDGVDAFLAITGLETPEAAYNVCSGRTLRIDALLAWILDEAGVEVEVVVDPERLREGEPRRLRGDPTRLHDSTGWEPRRSVEAAVRETYRWLAKTGG